MNKPLIIGFDGIDGTGKTSLIEKLKSDSAFKEKVIATRCREPPSPYIEDMYIQMQKYKESFEAVELFAKDLEFRYSKMPENKMILSDRTFFSALTFYNAISELSGMRDEQLCDKLIQGLQKYHPTLSIILLADVNTTRKRMIKRKKALQVTDEIGFQKACAKNFADINLLKNPFIINTKKLTKERVYNCVKEKLSIL